MSSLSRLEQPGPLTDAFFELVYRELHHIAATRMNWERSDHTLSATALVNEAYIRLSSAKDQNWESRSHFVAAASEAMRRVLIDRARAKKCVKRSSPRTRIDVDHLVEVDKHRDLLLEFEEAVDLLQVEDAQAAAFVRLRVFAGLNNTDAGAQLGMSQWASYRMWKFIQAWFSAVDRQDLGMAQNPSARADDHRHSRWFAKSP